jgi:tetratricopeptide (TPR) repeat protein
MHEANNLNQTTDEMIKRAGMLSLEHDEASLLEALQLFDTILNKPELKDDQRLSAMLGLAQANQRRGDHNSALGILVKIGNSLKVSPTNQAMVCFLMAISHESLGHIDESCKLFDETIRQLDTLDVDPNMRAGVALEAGKAFYGKGEHTRARQYWEQALSYYEGKEDEIEHYARTKANIALMLLNDSDEQRQKEGIKLLEESSEIKSQIGDLDGLATNYCNLGLFYWRTKHFERAIAYLRRDLYLSKKVGNLRSIATSLGNLSQLYASMNQFSPARDLLREVKLIGEKLGDKNLLDITSMRLEIVNSFAQKIGKAGAKIGPTAACACGSNKTYQECCGRADFEPIDIPIIFGGISQDLDQIMQQVTSSGVEPSRLDFILRQTPQSKNRFAWSRIHSHDGWLEMHELPDMANHHLIAASSLAKESINEPGSVTQPLACVILSACALEAFINQVSFFLNEVLQFHEGKLHQVPPELCSNVMDFQRNTKLEDKWDIVGRALCGDNWPPQSDLWNDFKNLIYIRNELVHFKVADYEQVVPLPKKPHEIMKRIPSTVETRKIPHGWPSRLLTPSFAAWSVSVAENMIDHFKQGYANWRVIQNK